MFLGTVPDNCLSQAIDAFGIGEWGEVFVCCSGTFRIERAILQKFPAVQIHSNDVSLYSAVIGRALAHETMDVRFVGKLDFIEPIVAKGDFLDRAAAVVLALEIAPFGIGKPSRYKRQMFAHHAQTFAERLIKVRAKLAQMTTDMQLASYFSGDWREHLDNAIAQQATVAAFPPFFKGDYEKMFGFVHDNAEWDAPSYPLYNPKDLGEIVRRLDRSGIRYCLLSDQLFDDPRPVMKYVQGRKVPHFCYGTAQRASYRHFTRVSTAFAYKPLDLARLKLDSIVRIEPALSAHANFLKDIYLAKSIIHTDGLMQFFVYLDDMLAGALIYSPSTRTNVFGRDSVYLMSDVVTTRLGKVSKLVARMALSSEILRRVEVKWIIRVNTVVTTARSKNPVSMKYRGIYKLHNRIPPAEPGGEFVLNYLGTKTSETPGQIYEWWWRKYGRRAVAEARSGDALPRPEEPQAA